MNDPAADVAPEHVFHFKDGRKAHNLKDLRDAVEGMADDVFLHHVDDTNNDFANWVEFVYKNPTLADDLREVSGQAATVEVLDAELGRYGGSTPDDEPVPEASEAQPEQPAEPDDAPKEPSKPERKQLHEDPIKLSDPPQTIETHDGKMVHSISTEAPHKFIIKEFFWGMLTGLLIGIILFASLMYFGLFPGV